MYLIKFAGNGKIYERTFQELKDVQRLQLTLSLWCIKSNIYLCKENKEIIIS